jgi:hypothetical protein
MKSITPSKDLMAEMSPAFASSMKTSTKNFEFTFSIKISAMTKIDNQVIEKVKVFKYLGVQVSFSKGEDCEISRRVSNAWKIFWSFKRYFTDKNLALIHKRKLMNMCVLPVLTYGAASWTLTDHNAYRLQVEQRAMERIMTGISRIHHVTNEKIRSKSKIKDVVTKAMELKWRWAGHVARSEHERVSNQVKQWKPVGRRSKGRPAKRWKDDIVKVGSIFWRRKARNRKNWKNFEIPFVQQWTD